MATFNVPIKAQSVSWASLGTTVPGQATFPAKQPVDDFSGLPFDLAVGEVYGMRVWRVDKYGRLRARHIDPAKPWRPGVNVAECHDATAAMSIDKVIDQEGRGRKAVDITTEYASMTKMLYIVRWADGSTSRYGDLKFDAASAKRHDVPDESCRCGFYAYTEPEHPELAHRTSERMVLGVVRGTGRTLLGALGFRSEKAEIVALIDPAGKGEGGANSDGKKLQQEIARVYPDLPMLGTRRELLEFAPVESLLPDPSTDEFWSLP